MTIDEQVTEHFKLKNCICPCCDRIKLILGFFSHMELLEQMRQELGFPLIINSGYRCFEHNTEIGGAPKSWHMLFATDAQPEWGNGFAQRLRAMYKVALVQDWGGIIYHNTFLHLDLRPEKYRARA